MPIGEFMGGPGSSMGELPAARGFWRSPVPGARPSGVPEGESDLWPLLGQARVLDSRSVLMNGRNKGLNRGFTLVEILIVVVILGILAAIVVPQFTNAANDARAGNLATQLKSLQNQIELYAAQNNGAYPDLSADWTALTGGNYIKDEPLNPAFPGDNTAKASVGESATAATWGSATTAWVWNSADELIRASYYDEDANQVTTTATD